MKIFIYLSIFKNKQKINEKTYNDVFTILEYFKYFIAWDLNAVKANFVKLLASFTETVKYILYSYM